MSNFENYNFAAGLRDLSTVRDEHPGTRMLGGSLLMSSRANLLAVVFIFLFTGFASSLCAQGTYTAASCNQSDVNAVINGPTHTAVDGDVIKLPAGTCSWTSSLSVTKGISIIGAGSGSTIIKDGYVGTLLKISPSTSSATFRLSGMTLQPTGGNLGTYPLASINGTCDTNTCSHVRWDNLNITGWTQGTNYNSFIMYADNVFGVFDHSTINFSGIFVNLAHSSYLGVGTYGDNSWAQPDSFGTDKALYFENNTIISSDNGFTDADFGGGPRFVVRFNNITNSSVQTHGTESTGRVRSARQVEVYNNTFTIASGHQGDILGLRGGTARVFNNTITGGGQFNSEVSMSIYRIGTSFSPWGFCDGEGRWDLNDGTVYDSGSMTSSTSGTNVTVNGTHRNWYDANNTYSVVDTTKTDSRGFHLGAEITSSTSTSVSSWDYAAWNPSNEPAFDSGNYQILRASACIDQPGRGGPSTYLSGASPTPVGWVNEPLDPVYEWGSTASINPTWGWVHPNWNAKLVANRDYYNQNSSFNGTSGTGTGTRANRPATCTTGVAYWATDEGNWNQSGSGGQGNLYICTATNTWTLSYTPYTYPHPLTGTVTTPPPSAPAPPTNLRSVSQ